jgi:hypothetical protein
MIAAPSPCCLFVGYPYAAMCGICLRRFQRKQIGGPYRNEVSQVVRESSACESRYDTG